MKIESLSIKSSTIAIFAMIGFMAILMSYFAANYFKKAALNAQINSLSRVIEVASQETLQQVKTHTFNLGMQLGYNRNLVSAALSSGDPDKTSQFIKMLDDPFVNGFVGFSDIDLQKIRIYNLQFELLAESSLGSKNLDTQLPAYLLESLTSRKPSGRLKATDALWISSEGPLFSTIVPLGGLRSIGYIEVVVNPVFNLPNIGKITKTPVRIYSVSGKLISDNELTITDAHLPVEFVLNASDGNPAFKIIGYENIIELNRKMEKAQSITLSGFLLLSFATLLFALWLFNRFLFSPVSNMIRDIDKITHGKLDLVVNNKGLREFHIFANAFNSMTDQVKIRTNDLQRLLDLDENALMCFDHGMAAVYFNKVATNLFGYTSDEIIELDIADLFFDDVTQLIGEMHETGSAQQSYPRSQLNCKHKDGHEFQCEALISPVDVTGRSGLAIALTSLNRDSAPVKNDQRLDAVEQTLSSLLTFAKDNPGILSGIGGLEQKDSNNSGPAAQKLLLREHAVKVMNLALVCWEHDLGKTKLELAEKSKIWPVYMDKSTPTTRTLDKYLNIDSCPRYPRSQRVIDTAEFVLRKTRRSASEKRKELQDGLESIRQLLSGIKTRS